MIHSKFELIIAAVVCLDVRTVYQSEMTIVSSFLVHLVNFGTVLCLTHRGIFNINQK